MTNSNNNNHIVVYADDDDDDLELVRNSFSLYSSDVDLKTFYNGLTALSFLRELVKSKLTPCLIILDVNMPLLNGMDTLLKIKDIEELKDVPVIMFSTSNNPSEVKFAKKYGADFITKPIDSNQMKLITNQFIDYCTTEDQEKIRKF